MNYHHFLPPSGTFEATAWQPHQTIEEQIEEWEIEIGPTDPVYRFPEYNDDRTGVDRWNWPAVGGQLLKKEDTDDAPFFFRIGQAELATDTPDFIEALSLAIEAVHDTEWRLQLNQEEAR